MYEIEYNGVKSSSLGLIIQKIADKQTPQLKYTEYEMPGGDGNLYETDGVYEDIIIPVIFNCIDKTGTWHETFRRAKKWLLSDGTKRLIFSDDEDFYYRVKRVEVSEAQRASLRVGVFTVSFICDPYQYLVSGDQEYSISDVLSNPYSVCHPIYIVSGHYGSYKLIVNGNTVEVYVSSSDGSNSTPTYIDTEKMMTYTENGMKNTYLTGDYESLYLQEGENTIETPKSTSGLSMGYTPTVKVIPRWRCI